MPHERTRKEEAPERSARKPLDFVKLSAAGNDFVLLDGRDGLPRPAEDKYAGQLPHSDPVFAVWGFVDT